MKEVLLSQIVMVGSHTVFVFLFFLIKRIFQYLKLLPPFTPERTFSDLKRLKACLSATMNEESLNVLALAIYIYIYIYIYATI